MKIIKTVARLFEHLLPLIKEEEAKGFKYMRDEDDGVIGKAGIRLLCTKRVYFDDSKSQVSFVDLTVNEKF